MIYNEKDEYLKQMTSKIPHSASQVSDIVSILGKKRTRVLTFIFEHIDKDKQGTITGKQINDFDLLLVPHATPAMLKEDEHLFFEFGGFKKQGYVNILGWLLTWKKAVKRSQRIDIVDHFFDQYFQVFPNSQQSLNSAGIQL